MLTLFLACNPGPDATTGPSPTALHLAVGPRVLGADPVELSAVLLDERNRPLDATPELKLYGAADLVPAAIPPRLRCTGTGVAFLQLSAPHLITTLQLPCVLPGTVRPPDLPIRLFQGSSAPMDRHWTGDGTEGLGELVPYWRWSAAPEGIAEVHGREIVALSPGAVVLRGALGSHQLEVPVQVHDPLGPDQIVVLVQIDKWHHSKLHSVSPDGWSAEVAAGRAPAHSFDHDADAASFLVDPAAGAIWRGEAIALEVRSERPEAPSTGPRVSGADTPARLGAWRRQHSDRRAALDALLDGLEPIGLSPSGRTLLVERMLRPAEGYRSASYSHSVIDLEAPELTRTPVRGDLPRSVVPFVEP